MVTGKVLFSERWMSMLGYEVNEWAPDIHTWQALMHPEDEERVMRNLNRHCEDGNVEYAPEFRLKTKSGGWKWIDARGEVVERDRDNKPLRMVGTHIDSTGRKLAEAERRALEAQLRQSQKLESMGTLASGVAHEINNPVMGIMNYAQLIQDGLAPGDELAGFAAEISKETDRVTTIVKDLLSFARHDDSPRSPARMCSIVESTMSLIRALLRQDQITLDVHVPEDLPLIECRSQQIQQIIMNLLTNSRDALNEKYEAFDANKKICITSRVLEKDGEQWIRTTIEDHGHGVAEDVLDRMFDPFYTTKPRDKGTGLGLSISHGIVKDHGGKLTVETEIGQWTRIHVDLPVTDQASTNVEVSA